MPNNEGTFRSALNGFNRNDVAAYIENAAARANAVKTERNKLAVKCTALEKDLAEAVKRCESAQAAEKAARDTLSGLTTELEAANALAAEQTQKLETQRQKNLELVSRLEELEQGGSQQAACEAQLRQAAQTAAALQSRLDTLQAEHDRRVSEDEDRIRTLSAALETARAGQADADQALAQRLAAAEKKAAEYDAVRERFVDLELGASRRAVEIEREAERNAQETLRIAAEDAALLARKKAEMAQDFRDCLRKLSGDTSRRALVLQDECGRLYAALQQLTGELEQSAADLDPSPVVLEDTSAAESADLAQTEAEAQTDEPELLSDRQAEEA